MKSMDNLSAYKGINQFGRAYEIMLKSDIHANNSVDRTIIENMIRLCDDTKEYLYESYTNRQVGQITNLRPELEYFTHKLTNEINSTEDKIIKITSYCSTLGDKIETDNLDDMVFGGTEEEIIKRGSNWCTDIARVACIMYQLSGLSSRIIQLFNIYQAYSGHVVNEVFRNNTWGVVDPTCGFVYEYLDGTPASAWDIMNKKDGIIIKDDRENILEIDFNQFSGVAISNYYINDHVNYDYSISKINQYYRDILEMSNKGWSDGIRWLHNEDNENQ